MSSQASTGSSRTRRNTTFEIINLSLGHAVTEPVAFDPLCAAVERAYKRGHRRRRAAGNAGKLADGTPVLGGIASPGNSPYAITVGATNTWGTTSRGDDTVTTYSSRGPTKWDNNAKPDLVAPGNKIISLEAAGSYISTHYPVEHIAGSGNNGYLRMSGTSMSAPMISGAAALLLQAQPSMSAAQVKFVLQSGSTYMVDAGVFGGGAGQRKLLDVAAGAGELGPAHLADQPAARSLRRHVVLGLGPAAGRACTTAAASGCSVSSNCRAFFSIRSARSGAS